MHGRSRAEFFLVAHYLDACGELNEANLIKVLNDGNRILRTDAAFFKTTTPGFPEVLLEYDPGYTHGLDRLEGDCKKTNRLLAEGPQRAMVVRLRVDAPLLVKVPREHPRLILLETGDANLRRLAHTTLRALFERCPEQFSTDAAKRVASLRSDVKNRCAEDVVHRLMMRIDCEYKRNIEQLSSEYGQGVARKLLKTNGVKSKLSKFMQGMRNTQAELGLTKTQIVSLASNGCTANHAAARLPRLQRLHG